MRKGWLSDANWQFIQSTIPVPCVDVLFTKKVGSKISAIGLIYRDTPHEGTGWCLIGGRLLLNESFKAAIGRQLRETLGTKARCILPSTLEPLLVTEYFSLQRRRALFDPRKHAVSVVFSAQLRGAIKPRGEAFDFRWFDPNQLPSSNAFGFGQKKVVAECLRRLRETNR